jgi:hypothetical protein
MNPFTCSIPSWMLLNADINNQKHDQSSNLCSENHTTNFIDDRVKNRLKNPDIFPELFKVESADITDSSQPVRLYTMKQEKLLAETHENTLCFPVLVNNVEKVTANLDTGAQMSTISLSLLKELQSKSVVIIDPSSTVRLVGINNKVVPQPHLPVNIVFHLGKTTFSLTCAVREHRPHILFGMDMVKKLKLSFFFGPDGKSYVTTQPTEEVAKEAIVPNATRTNSFTLTNQGKVTLRPGKNKIKVHCIQFKNQNVVLEAHESLAHRAISIDSQINKFDADGNCLIIIKNFKSHKVRLGQNETPIANIKALEAGDALHSAEMSEILDEWGQLKSDDTVEDEPQSLYFSKLEAATVQPIHMIPVDENGVPEITEQDIDKLEPRSFPMPNETEEVDWEKAVHEKDIVPAEFREEFIAFLKERPQLLSKHEYDVGKLNPRFKIKFDIPTGSSRPVFHRGYQMNGIRQAQIRSALQKLEKHGVITRGTSPWSNPVFLVSKGDGRVRLTTDYRKLNSLVEIERFPIRNIGNLLQELAFHNHYSLLDLTQGYSCVETTPEARLKLSLISGERQYLTNRMLFGAANAPAVFSNIMDVVLQDVKHRNGKAVALFYLDDIIVKTRGSRREHFEDLLATMSILADAGLKLNILKLDTFKSSLKVLGRQIDALGFSPIPKHVKAVQSFPAPKDRQALMRFLGLTNYHSVVIPNYSQTIEPLSKLNREVPFIWGTEQQDAFDNLKRLISVQAKTYFVDYTEDLYLSTDASDTHLAGFLYQVKAYTKEEWEVIKEQLEEIHTNLSLLPKPHEQTHHPIPVHSGKNCPKLVHVTGGKMPETTLSAEEESNRRKQEEEKIHIILPVGYYSRKFAKSQSSWTILEREAFAVSSSFAHFKEIMLPAPRTYLLTDSAVYLWILRSAKLGNSKIQRWLIQMSQVPHQIIASHAKNRNNAMTVADALSRPLYKVITDKKFSNKISMKVHSPFPIGKVLTVKDIEKALEQNPSLVEIVPAQRSVTTKKVQFVSSQLITSLKPLLTTAKFMEGQRSDPFISKRYNDLMDKGDSSNYAKSYKIHQGLLYKRFHAKDAESNTSPGRLYVPSNMIGLLLAAYHCDNHQGARGLEQKLQVDYFFPGMQAATSSFTASCHLCAVYNICHNKVRLQGNSIFPTTKLEVWSIDENLGLPKNDNTNGFLLCVEYFSNFKLILPLKHNTGHEISLLLEQHIFSVFPNTRLIISDNGSNLLKNKHVRAMLNKYGVEGHTTSPYRPQTHGKVEIGQRHASHLIRILMQQLNTTWPRVCKLAQLALNNMISGTLGNHSPSFFMFGVQQENNTTGIHLAEITDSQEEERTWKRQLEKCNKIVEEYAQKRNMLNLSKGGKPLSTPPGSYVYCKDFSLRGVAKIRGRYHPAPERVVREYPATILTENFLGQCRKRHKANVKPMKEREYQLFENLPTRVKAAIGDAFTYEDLNKYMDNNEIPNFYKGTPLPDPLPFTRLEETEDGEEGNGHAEPQDPGRNQPTSANNQDDEPQENDDNAGETNRFEEIDVIEGQDSDNEDSPPERQDENTALQPGFSRTLDPFQERRQLRPSPKKKVIFDL